MKDATGELSMTAVAVVAIAAISVLFSTLIWPSIRNNITRQTHCTAAYGCTPGENPNVVNCYYLDDEGEEKEITCTGSDVSDVDDGL